MSATTFGFIGLGEVGSIFSRALREHGAEIIAYDIREQKARTAEVRFAPLPQLVDEADYILSTVTTEVAIRVAQDCAAHLKPGRIYLDLNSTSPAVKVEIGTIIERTGADFVEGAILGAVGATGAVTPILTGGSKGHEAAGTLTRFGLNVSYYHAEIGKASMFKMLRSVFSKGMEALILEFLIAAKRAGIEEDLWKDVCQFMSQASFDGAASNWVRSHPVSHERKYHEMVQVKQTMREAGLDPVMTTATETFFDRSRALGFDRAFPHKPGSMETVTDFMERRLRPGGA